jgi:hypothetical protein
MKWIFALYNDVLPGMIEMVFQNYALFLSTCCSRMSKCCTVIIRSNKE